MAVEGAARTALREPAAKQELTDNLGCLRRGRGQSFPGCLWAVTEYRTIPAGEVAPLSGKCSLGTPQSPGLDCLRSVLQSGVLPTQSPFPPAVLHTGQTCIEDASPCQLLLP